VLARRFAHIPCLGLRGLLYAGPDGSIDAFLAGLEPEFADELRQAECGFFDFAMSAALGHRDYFRSLVALPEAREAEFEREATESLERQRDIEAADDIGLDEYIARYFEID